MGTADEDMELPGMLERCVKLISGVKKVVAEMRATVKLVVSHREKCSMILSAAMAASVALDQVTPGSFLLSLLPISVFDGYSIKCSKARAWMLV